MERFKGKVAVVTTYITGQVFYVDGGMLAQLNTPRWRRRDDQRGSGRER